MRHSSARKNGVYASKIIRAGALLADTKTLLSLWEPDKTKTTNLERFRSRNLFGKASRTRTRDILAIFRQRYLADESVLRALTYFVKKQMEPEALNTILYFHACQTDRLLHDVVVRVLCDQHMKGKDDVSQPELERIITRWVGEGKMRGEWSAYTIRRVTQGLLATLRDFGLLAGAVNKQLAPSFVPPAAFAHVAFFLWQRLKSGSLVLESEEWKLFLLSPPAVERLFLEAHQRGLLEYHAAGSVVRIEFPAKSLEEYAHVIVEGSH